MSKYISFYKVHPVRQWPKVTSFIVRRLWYPRIMSKVYYATPTEVRAMEHVIKSTKPGNPEAVLRALDEFGNREFLMNVGDEKGPILTDVIKERQPKTVLELGAYLGYSAIEIARHLPTGAKLISVEINPLHAAIADKLVDWAGLRDRVQIIIGSSSEVIRDLKDKYGVTSLDIVFFDHWKDLYLPDLKELEQTGLLVKGKTVIVADNVLWPGAPDYLKYVSETNAAKPPDWTSAAKEEVKDSLMDAKGSDASSESGYKYDTKIIDSHVEYLPTIPDIVTVSLVQ